MSQRTRRSSLVAVVFLSVGALVGGLIGGNAQAESRSADDQSWKVGRILALVEDNFVGETDSEELVEDAIGGLLRTLDPHSNYLSAETFSEMRDEQRGKFHGLGIQITKRGTDKPLTIIAPIDGTPASRAGLMSGDVISHIEGEPTIDLTVTQAVRLLKGDKGTEVTITIDRPGAAESFDVIIERDEIPIESLRLAYMLTDDVGFIRISNFTSTTANELDAAVARLKEEGMTKLMLDLRGNPGGLLDQAVQVSERFIPSGRLLVYTRGRISGSNQDFVAKRGANRLGTPLVVLVDNSSASASEIVSGAVQDHDRGLVVGETSFGKGLVQRVIPLRDGGALAVTTAKYYTPSGRLIQRDYSDLEEYYLTRPDEDEEEGAGADLPAPTDGEDTQVFYTSGGRKVYGGGGIRPDYIVKSQRASHGVLQMLRENLFFDFAVRYTNAHPDLKKSFKATDEMFVEYRSFINSRNYEYDPQEFEEAKDEIAVRLRAQIARVKWDQVEEGRILAEADHQVQRALELFDEAAKLAHLDSSEDEPVSPGLRAEAR
jgi:carboxyl-terminal processing protease